MRLEEDAEVGVEDRLVVAAVDEAVVDIVAEGIVRGGATEEGPRRRRALSLAFLHGGWLGVGAHARLGLGPKLELEILNLGAAVDEEEEESGRSRECLGVCGKVREGYAEEEMAKRRNFSGGGGRRRGKVAFLFF